MANPNLLDPVDISSKLPKDLLKQLASGKWQERKAALDLLYGILTENPKLADNPDYNRQTIDQLIKMLGSDANIQCAAEATKNLLGFARGLRTKFGPYTASVAPMIFEKFKEKKAILHAPLVELADAVYANSNLTTLLPFIMEALSKPSSPDQQKAQLDLFLQRIFHSIQPKDIPKGALKGLMANLFEQTFVPDPEVREASLAALGAIQKCVGEKSFAATKRFAKELLIRKKQINICQIARDKRNNKPAAVASAGQRNDTGPGLARVSAPTASVSGRQLQKEEPKVLEDEKEEEEQLKPSVNQLTFSDEEVEVEEDEDEKVKEHEEVEDTEEHENGLSKRFTKQSQLEMFFYYLVTARGTIHLKEC